jgi:WD40 repeat protein
MTMEKINQRINQKPVIFLAFANDRVDNAAYLRNLPKELRGIREELEKAKNKNLCEVVERSNAAIEDILDVFQDDAYKNRIAIFHYGGHASGYQLLLESLAGGHAPAHREGLAAFLARQEGLKFVFLNGCSTQQHALELTKAGIPAVVGTSQSINDEVATNLAIRFYNGIANGATLERGWLDAEDYIKTQKGTANFRALYWEGKEEIEDRFPWDIFYKKGSEKVKGWNLPEAANDPLFGMPEVPDTYGLPETPFLFLNRYERKHAKLFFGRSPYIRELYNRITDPKSPPIILLYGQSGVGKSSILDAGLMPRIQESHTVFYIRRIQKKGLIGSLEGSLQRDFSNMDHLTLGEKWKQIESQTNKPLVIILDQVEEVFTHSNKDLPNEFRDFMETMKKIFENSALYPGGKLILAYRKEYHPEIDKAFGIYELPRAWVFLQSLDRRDIMEVVTGLTQTSELIQRYNLKVDEELPVIIADDLLADKNSPVAPVLQILLTKMWNRSKKDEFSPNREFTVEQYQVLRRQGIAMKDFFEQQMEKLKNWKPEVVDSGLALDILKYHTTELGTARSRSIEELRHTYGNMSDISVELIKKLKDSYLLTEAQHKDENSLAHDTLAPVVIDEYNDSNRLAQRASRIMAAKIGDFKKNKNKNKVFLDEVDLEIVEDGKVWMRAWDQDEEQLVAQSRERRAQREKKEKRNKTIRIVLVIFIFIFAVFAVIFALSATHQKRIALDRSRKSEANRLVAIAERELEKNPTIALGDAEKAYQLDKNEIVIDTRQKIYRENNFYKIIARQKDSISCAVFSPDGKYILTGSAYVDNNAYLWNLNGEQIRVLKGHEYCIISIAFSSDGKYILTGSKDRTARLWDLEGTPLGIFEGHRDWVYSVAFSPGGEYILTGSRDRTARLWDKQGKQLHVFKGHDKDVLCAVFSPDGKYVLTGSVDETARLWDLQNKKELVVLKKYRDIGDKDGGNKDGEDNDWVYSVAFSPDGKYILTGSRDKTARLWNWQENEENGKPNRQKKPRPVVFRGHKDVVNSVAFSPDGNYILTGSWDKTARLWALKGNKLQDFIGHEKSITSAVFSPDGQSILTGSWDKTIRRWDLNGIKFQVLPAHQSSIIFAAYSPNGKYILTGLKDGTAHLSDLQGQALKVFRGHTGPVISAAFSPDGRSLLTGSADQTACLWSFPGHKLQDFKGHKDCVTSVAFSPDGNSILTASWDNTARLWNLQGKVIHEFKEHKDDVNCAVFSPDGEKILTASWDHTAILWNLPGDMIRKFTSPGSLFSSAAFSPDGKYILTGSNDGIDVKVRLWDLAGNILRELTGHQYRISSAAFSPNGQYILTGSWDKTARLWDLNGNELQVFKGHERKVNSAVFSPDGKRVLTGSADKTTRIWEIRMTLAEFLEKGIYEEFPEEQIWEK